MEWVNPRRKLNTIDRNVTEIKDTTGELRENDSSCQLRLTLLMV